MPSPSSLTAGEDALRRRALLLLVVFIGLAILYSVITPLFEGYDEDSHFAFVQHVATGQGLPRQPASQYPHLAKHEANQPPLYYVIAAALTWWIPTGDLPHYLRQNPHAVYFPLPYHDNQNGLLHDDSERFPYSGTVLAVHLARLLSVLFGAGSVYCTFALARALFPANPQLALGALAVHALTPSFIFGSALVNNDSLVALTSGLSLLLLVRVWQQPFSWRRFVLLGAVLGITALSKLSALWVWPLAALLMALLAWRDKNFWRTVRAGALVFAIALLISGWWYARNWVYYGDSTGINVLLDIIGRREKGFSLLDFLPETEGIRWSYWALFGWFNVPVADWLYRLYDVLLLVALAGFCEFALVAWRARRWAALGAAALPLAWFVLVLAALVNLNLVTIVAQGRLLFPAASAISILLVLGWQQWLPTRLALSRWIPSAATVAMLALAVAVPFAFIAPVYATPEALSPTQAAAQLAQRSDARFEDKVTLLGIGFDQPEVHPGDLLWVRACWKDERLLREDDFVFVQLLGDDDLIAAQKDTYPGLGNFPTSRWPAGVTFCESYPLPVRDSAPPAASTQIAIGLYRASGERLAVYNASGGAAGNDVRLTGPRLAVTAQRDLGYEWGHRVALVDYRLSQTGLAPGDTLDLALTWRVLQSAEHGPAATVQILDAAGNKAGQSDAALSLVQPAGTLLTDQRSIHIAPGAASGVYDIKLGVYEPATVQNLLLYQHGRLLLGGGLLPLWQVRLRAKAP